MSGRVEPKKHYPFVTEILIDLFNNGELPNVQSVMIEPRYGYVGRIEYTNDKVHVFRSTNLGVNSLGASEISKDKGYTKFFLQKLGYNTPEGEIFLMPEYKEKIEKRLGRNNFSEYQRSTDEAFEYVESGFGYPCYAKPNFGSQGRGIWKCENRGELENAIDSFKGERMVLLEKAVNMPDYRVVVLGEEVISCYKRIPLHVVGDGLSSVRDLLERKQENYFRTGRKEVIDINDEKIGRSLKKKGYSLDSVISREERVQLLDVSNLSLGGESEEFTHKIHQRWKDLSIGVTREMGLKLCGVDIACSNIESQDSEYSILEINAAPGLDNYASSGEEQLERVKRLYSKVFNDMIHA